MLRDKRRRLKAILPDETLLWGLDGHQRQSVEKLISALGGSKGRRFARKVGEIGQGMLARLNEDAYSTPLALASLAWCHALPRLARHLDERIWWSLLDRLIQLARRPLAESHDLFRIQLLRGELGLQLAYCFPELLGCRNLLPQARRAIAQSLAEQGAPDAWPRAETWRTLQPLVASWTRCLAVVQELDKKPFSDETIASYSEAVQAALRFTRPNGTMVFSPLDSSAWDPSLLATAAKLGLDRDTRRMARGLLKKKKHCKPSRINVPAALDAENACLAVLRRDWQHKAASLTVDYSRPTMVSELSVGSRTFWSGEWQLDVRHEGQPLVPQGAWQQHCWFSDGDADYLELSIELGPHVAVDRHIVLIHSENALLLADAVRLSLPGRVEYRGMLALEPTTRFEGAGETREGTLLVNEKPRARILPIGLPEWRAERAGGELRASERGIELSVTAAGPLFVPLWIDLNPKRIKREVTWRQLTVGQDAQIVPRTQAVGYRVQAGRQQWVIYRSLAQAAIRTVLSKSLMTEFFVGRLQPDGTMNTIVEIEPLP